MLTNHRKKSWCDTWECRPKNIPAELDRNVILKIGSQLRGHYDYTEVLGMPSRMIEALEKIRGK